MEDTYHITDNFANDPTCGLFSIFDGHGGRTVSEFIAERLPQVLRKDILLSQPSDLTSLLTTTFAKLDKETRLIDSDNQGTTACVTVIRKEDGVKRVVYVANCGDTRCVVGRKGGGVERLSYDHRASDAMEVSRIRKKGGFVM